MALQGVSASGRADGGLIVNTQTHTRFRGTGRSWLKRCVHCSRRGRSLLTTGTRLLVLAPGAALGEPLQVGRKPLMCTGNGRLAAALADAHAHPRMLDPRPPAPDNVNFGMRSRPRRRDPGLPSRDRVQGTRRAV